MVVSNIRSWWLLYLVSFDDSFYGPCLFILDELFMMFARLLGLFGLRHEMECHGSVPYVDLILMFGWEEN